MQVFTKSIEAHSKTSSSKTTLLESSVSSPFFQPKPIPNTEDGVQRQATVPFGAQGLPATHWDGNGQPEGAVQRLCMECRQDAEPEEVQRQEIGPEEEVQRQAGPFSLSLQRAEKEPEEVQRQAMTPEEESEEVQRQAIAPEEEPEAVQRQADPLSLSLQRAEEEPEEIQRQEIGSEEEVQRQAGPLSLSLQRAEEEAQRQEAIPQSQTPSNSPAEASGTKPAISSEAPSVSLAHAIPVSATAPSPVVQPSLQVGAPDSPLEREADEMAERVQRMPQKQWAAAAIQVVPPAVQRQEEEEEVQAKFAQRAPELQRSVDGGMSTSSQFASRLQSTGSGNPLPPATQQHMEGAFGADFSTVRIHTGPQAARLSSDIGALAFTHKNNIFFNSGAYNPDTPSGQKLLAHELTHTVQQGAAVQRAELTAAPEMVQGFGIVDLIPDWIIERARHIPGYTLFTVIILYDPLLERRVERTPVNLLEGLMGLVPFGTAIFDKLQEYGIIQRVFEWVENQLTRLRLGASDIMGLVEEAWDELEFPYDNAIEVITRKFNQLKNRVIDFALTLVDQIITWIKEALIGVAEPYLNENRAWSLIKKIIRYDPLRDETVNATTVEILEDFLLLIGRQTELEQMRERGTLQRTADWLDTQVGTFMSLLSELRGLIVALWNAVQPSNLVNIVDNLQALARDTGNFLQRVWDFALEVALTVLQYVKDALLGWLREHASGIRGYRLMTVILGKDPVTDERVERNARNILSGFVELVAGPEQFREIEQSGAIERMVSWLDNLVERTGISIRMVVDLFMGIWNSVTIQDLVHPIDTFNRIVDRFGDPIRRVLTFIVEVIKKVIEIVLQLMNVPVDLVMQIIERAMAAFDIIQRDPIAFLINILRALKQGFQQFFDNILTHLIGGLTGWLFGELRSAGIQPPQELSFRAIVAFVLDVLGISMERIWQKLAEHPRIGPERVAMIRGMIGRLTGIWTVVQDVINEGPGALWRHLQEHLSNLWDRVLDYVKDWVMEQIVTQMVTRLLSMLDPSGIMAVIRSVEAFYRAVQSFIERLREILEIVNSFVGGILEIARGDITTAANFLERTMASAIPTIIGFLANQIGLRGLGARIGEMVQRIREVVDNALTRVIHRIVDVGFSVLDRLLAAGRSAAGAVMGWLGLRRNFRDSRGESHSLYTANNNRDLLVASGTPQPVRQFLANLDLGQDQNLIRTRNNVQGLLDEMDQHIAWMASPSATDTQKEARRGLIEQLAEEISNDLSGLMAIASINEFPRTTNPTWDGAVDGFWGRGMRVQIYRTPPPGGSPTGTATNNSWEVLKKRKNGNNTYYVRGHLLNNHLGGPGNNFDNLTPQTGSSNRNFDLDAETYIKNRLSITTGTSSDSNRVETGMLFIYVVIPAYGRSVNDALIDRINAVPVGGTSIAGSPPSQLTLEDKTTLINIVNHERYVPTVIRYDIRVMDPITDTELPNYSVRNHSIGNEIDQRSYSIDSGTYEF